MPRAPRNQRPLISANFAITWDGRISTRRHTPSDFSSREDKRRFLEIRALADAVIATVKTAAADHMTMGLSGTKLRAARRARGQEAQPLRVLVTNSGRIPLDLALWEKPGAPVVIFTGQPPAKKSTAALAGKAELRVFARDGQLDLQEMTRVLRREYGIRRLHCEGGGEFFHALAGAGLVDELYLTLCPRIFGGENAPTLTGRAGAYLPASVEWRLRKMEQVGDECFLHYRAR